jgi:Luciferase-like monooxygenase
MRLQGPAFKRGVKRIGFLSFGHWSTAPGSQVRSASDSLLQSIDLAVATEELGADGAYFRVHHFAQQLGSPFPLPAAVGAKTSRIEIGTAVIDMRYDNRSTSPRTQARPTSSRAAVCSLASAGAPPSRLSTAGGTSATSRPTARATSTWPANTPRRR